MKRQLLACLIAAALGASVASATPLDVVDRSVRVRPELRPRFSWRTLIKIDAAREVRELADFLSSVDWLRIADDLVHLPRLARRVADSIS